MKKAIKKAYQKERGITPRIGKKGISFQVRVFIPEYIENKSIANVASFSECKYGSEETAFKAAKLFRDKIEEDIKNNALCIKRIPTMNELFNEKNIVIPKSLTTLEKHRSFYNKYIMTFLGDKKINMIGAKDIQMTLNGMITTSLDDTIQRVFSIWKQLIKTALINDYINYDPTIKVIVPKSKKISIKKSVEIEESTILKMLDILKNSSGRIEDKFNHMIFYYLIILMYYVGIRPSEAYALAKKDIDISNRLIHIKYAIGSTTEEKYVKVPCKTEGSTRILPIPQNLMPFIKELLIFQHSPENLFTDYFGNYLKTDHVADKLGKIAKKNGLSFNLYMLRHKLVTDILENESINDRTAMELLGHSSYSMTVSYARSNDALKKKALELRKLN